MKNISLRCKFDQMKPRDLSKLDSLDLQLLVFNINYLLDTHSKCLNDDLENYSKEVLKHYVNKRWKSWR